MENSRKVLGASENLPR
jgi:hypothetical protein